jgi:hypothetical protein
MIEYGHWPKLNLGMHPQLDWSLSAHLQEKSRPRTKNPPATVVGLNRALHVAALKQLGNTAKDSWDAVAKIWGNQHAAPGRAQVKYLTPNQVKDDATDYPQAVQIMEEIVTLVCGRDGRSRGDVLRDLDADLRERAEYLGWFKLAGRLKRP